MTSTFADQNFMRMDVHSSMLPLQLHEKTVFMNKQDRHETSNLLDWKETKYER